MTTTLLFSGVIGSSKYDSIERRVEVAINDETLIYATVQPVVGIRVHSIEDALNLVEANDLITFVTPDSVVEQVRLLNLVLVERQRFLKRPVQQLVFTFTGELSDWKKLLPGSSIQVYKTYNI